MPLINPFKKVKPGLHLAWMNMFIDSMKKKLKNGITNSIISINQEES